MGGEAAPVSQQTMLELSDPPDAQVRGHGACSVRIVVAGSLNANPGFICRQYGTGKVFLADMLDVRLEPNPGDPRDGIEIPASWPPVP